MTAVVKVAANFEGMVSLSGCASSLVHLDEVQRGALDWHAGVYVALLFDGHPSPVNIGTIELGIVLPMAVECWDRRTADCFLFPFYIAGSLPDAGGQLSP